MVFLRMRACAVALGLPFAATLTPAQDYPPGQATAPDTGRTFGIAPSSLISEQYYGIAHGGGNLAISGVSFSGGLANFTLSVNMAPWAARSSEGVFFSEIWVERSSGGGWSGGVEGYSGVYGVNVNSGTPPGGGWSWSKPCQAVAPGTQFRAFGYCYMYNQGGGTQGEFALYSWTAPVTVPAPAQMTPPTSADSTAIFGSGWAPAVSGGEGTGAYLYCVGGQTNFATISTPWAPTAAGSYSFWVGQMPDGTNAGNVVDPRIGEMEVNPTPYTLTVSKASQYVASTDAAITYGQSFTPVYFPLGGTGSGQFQFCIVNQTNFNGGATPDAGTSDPARGDAWEASWPAPPAGIYQFMVAEDGNDAYGPANPGTYYTLTVNPAPPPAVTISPSSSSVATGGSVDLTAGNGLNGYVWSVSPAGPAEISGNGASRTISFPAPGSYTASVYSPAGGNYTDSNTASALISVATPQYTLTTAAVGDGSVTPGGTYPANTILSVSATPGPYAGFAGWTGSLSSQSNPLSVVLTGDLTLYGNFYFNPANPPSVTVSPSSASVATGSSVDLTAGDGLNGYVWSVSPAGPAGISGNGASQTILFPAPGSYTVSVYSPAGGNYTSSNTAAAVISVTTPQYTLTTGAAGNGSVTPGGTYPANTILTLSATPGTNAAFTGWTGSLSSQSNPLSVTLTGDLTLYGNFYSLQAQTIDFPLPGAARYPGSPIALTASATSGLPVDFTVVGGPAWLAGPILVLTGTGPVTVQASQAGNSFWLPAESVTAAINVSAPPSIARIRFHASGHDATISAPGRSFGASSLWTDPTGLQASPWPSFGSPSAAIPGASDTRLPAVPRALPPSP